MAKIVVVSIMALAFFMCTMPASGDTIFNEMSKGISNMGKCATSCVKAATAPATDQAATPAKGACKPCPKTDVLGNKVPGSTEKGGKVNLGQ